MSFVDAIFLFFAGLSAMAAIAIVFSKNVFRSALWLLVCLLSLAGLYVLSTAEFLAVAQILIYAGGILVILLFGIMLTTRISGKPLVVEHRHILSGALTAVALFVLLSLYLPGLTVEKNMLSPEPVSTLGLQLFSQYSLVFEIAGVLLLVALIGAAVIASELKSKT